MHNQVNVWDDPTVTYFEPSFGNGAFLLDAATRFLSSGLKPRQVALLLRGIEIDPKYVKSTRFKLIELLGYPEIINKNLMEGNFFSLIKEMPKTNNLVVCKPYSMNQEAAPL
jgi:hypothetical protein